MNKKDGLHNIIYSKNQQMGVNYISKLTQPLAQVAGCSNYNSISGNSIRRYVLTKLANDNTLSQKEVQEHALHCSASAQNHYITTNEDTQIQHQMVMAQGFNFLREDNSLVFVNHANHHPVRPRMSNPYIRTSSGIKNPYI